MSTAKKIILGIIIGIAAVYLCGFAVFSFFTYPDTTIYQEKVGVSKRIDAVDKAKEMLNGKTIEIERDGKVAGSVTPTYQTEDDEFNIYEGGAALWPLELFKSHSYGKTPTLNQEDLKRDISDITGGGKAPENAYLQYKDGKYEIVPETEGTTIDQTKALEAVMDAIDAGTESCDISECKETAKVTKEDKQLNETMDTANKMIQTKIAYSRGNISLELSNDDKEYFISVADDGSVTIDREKVLDYALKTISGKFDSMGQGVTLTRPDGSTLSVEGGSWGYNVDSEKETDAIIEAMTAGKDRVGEPIYKQDGSNAKTYVEVDIANQQVHVVIDGQEKLVADCVTGNPSTGHSTHTGAYYIYAKLPNWTMVKYDAFVRFWMPFNGDEGLHDASWRSSFGGNIYKTNGSHGCTNLSYDTAKFIYDNCPTGTLVVVH